MQEFPIFVRVLIIRACADCDSSSKRSHASDLRKRVNNRFSSSYSASRNAFPYRRGAREASFELRTSSSCGRAHVCLHRVVRKIEEWKERKTC